MLKTTNRFQRKSWGRRKLFKIAHRDLTGILCHIQWQPKIRRGVERVVDVGLIGEPPIAVILDDGKMQVHAHRAARRSGIIPLVTQQRAGRYEKLRRPGWKLGGNVGTAGCIRHVRVIDPDLPSGLERIRWDADDEG